MDCEFVNDTRSGVRDLPLHGQKGWAPPNFNRVPTSMLNESRSQSQAALLVYFDLDGCPPSAPSGLTDFNQSNSSLDYIREEFTPQFEASTDLYNALDPTALDTKLNHTLNDLDPRIRASNGSCDASYTFVPCSVNLAHNVDPLISSSSQENVLGLPLVEEPESASATCTWASFSDIELPSSKISGCIQYGDFVPALPDYASLACPPPWLRDQDTQASYWPLPRTTHLDPPGVQHPVESSLIQRPTSRSDGIVVESYYPPNISAGRASSFDPNYHIARCNASSFPNTSRTNPARREHPLYKESSSPISSLCRWQHDDRTICGEMITNVTLPGHLAIHGIKNKGRDCPTICQWVGCKRRRPVNRECIVRHIREVHMRLKRSPSSTSVRPLHSM